MILPELLLQPAETARLGDFLLKNLQDTKWENFRAAVAFVKQSGASHISPALAAFANRGKVKISFGISHKGTTKEGVTHLLDAVKGRGEIWVFHNETGVTFHPKVYLFKNTKEALVAIGSGNLTEGGLFTNYEAGVVISLDLTKEPEKELLAKIEERMDQWSDPAQQLAHRVTPPVLARLIESGKLPSEAQARQLRRQEEAGMPAREARPSMFGRVAVPRAPRRQSQPAHPEEAAPQPPAASSTTAVSVFLMTLQKTDVGRGQTHAGTARRSPELFIPLAARDYAPDFWDWSNKFIQDSAKPGKWDRRGVNFRLGGSVIPVNMMTWPDKSDFRLRSEALRSAGNIGDILRLEKVAGGTGFDYYAEIIPQGTVQHSTAMLYCSNKTKGKSKKLWGYF